MIKIENLSKVYQTNGKNIMALKDISLEINDGEIFGIMGLSGAGKSSLIRCINRLEEPTEGSIIINDRDIMSLDSVQLREMRKKIGMIFQHFNLLTSRTVYQNIAFPLKISGGPQDEIDVRVKDLLGLVGLADKKDSYPSKLSGGQKQRVGIARALAGRPTLLLSDEATSSLDPQTTGQILSLLKDINRRLNLTIIIISHQMEVIREICDRVAVLNSGEVVETGNTIDIFSRPSSPITEIAGESGRVIRVIFLGENAREPIMSRLVKSFDVYANILSGNIQRIHGEMVGNLIFGLEGSIENIEDSTRWLEKQGLQIEVLK